MDRSEAAELKNGVAKDEHLIKAAISKYGVEVLVEDRTFEIISAIVFRRLKYAFGGQTRSTDEASTSSGFTFSGLLNALSFVISIVVLYILIFGRSPQQQYGIDPSTGLPVTPPNAAKDEKGKKGVNSNKKDTGPQKCREFGFQTGNELSKVAYHGREKDFKDFYGYITTFITKLSKLTREKMDDMNEFSKQNYLLEGPPGTGKTVFVQYLAKEIDDYLKLEHLKKTDSVKYMKILNDEEAKEIYLEEAESRVYYSEVSPGIINSKWFGQSEVNIKTLFEKAKEFSEDGRAVFLFFDEGDVFFGKRGSEEGGSQATAGVKSELLQRIGIRPKDKYRPIFVFCATNRFEVFDDAFKRRFGVQRRFGLPNETERRGFIKALLSEFEVTDDEIEKIVYLTQGRSQSYISNNLKRYYATDSAEEICAFKMRDFLEFLHGHKDDKNLQ